MQITSKLYAIEKHGEQRYGSLPYEHHLEMVASIIREYFEGHHYFDSLINVAYLHDVLEDTDTTIDDLLDHFNVVEAYAVYALSDVDAPNRKERKKLTYLKFTSIRDHLIKGFAASIKFADRLANLRQAISYIKNVDDAALKKRHLSLLKLYQKEHQLFVSTYQDFVFSESLKSDVIYFDFKVGS